MRMMGRFLYWGARGMPRDHTRALSYFRRAAELGDVHSMLTLGEMLARGVGMPDGHQDPHQAMKWFRLAAEKGYPPAHNGIGFLFARGKGVPQNYTKVGAPEDCLCQLSTRASCTRGMGGPCPCCS